MDLHTEATLIAGIVAPFLTDLVKNHLIKVQGKAAQVLSLVTAAGCVVAADVITKQPLSLMVVIPMATTVWTLSQVIYRQVEGTPLAKIFRPGR